MTEYVISTMEDTNNVILSVADKVRDIDSLSEWWVLTLYCLLYTSPSPRDNR